MRTRRLALGALAIAAVASIAVVLKGSSRDDAYHLAMRVSNAEGLHSGSPVVRGGIPIGKVAVSLRSDGKVDLDLAIDRKSAPVSRNASLSVRAINLLGQKQLQLIDSGGRADPAPSGFRIPSKRFNVSTDLDKVIDVLDPGTRVRLGILLNETGRAVAGRRRDIKHLIAELPGGLSDVQRVLDAVNSDNRAVGHLVETSDAAIGAFNAQRPGIDRMVDTLARTATTVSSQRDNLEHTIQNAPGTLATLRTFLGRLDHLTASVRPAARLIASAAPALSRALAQIPSFQRAAVPTLDKATTVSRVLTSLADGATPVLRRAVPVTRTLATLSSSALPPVTSVLDRSEDNVFAILDNWSRAIQFRDGLGHIFRGSAGVAPDMLDSAIRRALGRDGSRPKVPRKPSLPDLHKSGPVAGALPKPPAVDVPGKVGSILDKVEQGITHVTAPKPPPPPARPPSPPTPDKGLLDYLLKP